MKVYEPLYAYLEKMGMVVWRDEMARFIADTVTEKRFGKLPMWYQALDSLPNIQPGSIELKSGVDIGNQADLNGADPAELTAVIKQLHPWRKGPFRLFGIDIDTEWRSDWKWERVVSHIEPLQGRRVLDVGGGNGYHGWRMLGEGAEFVLGIDPTMVFSMQYRLIQHFINSERHFVVPLGIEHMPQKLHWFDTVFSMGVLYHRRSPLEHLMELRGCLKSGGQLVLETLIVDGEEGMSLMPENRYAKMKNVWFIPSIATTLRWLQRCGYKNIRCMDENVTSLDEQRSTEWMTFESLVDFLDKEDVSKTVEGYPAPKRAVFTAIAP